MDFKQACLKFCKEKHVEVGQALRFIDSLAARLDYDQTNKIVTGLQSGNIDIENWLADKLHNFLHNDQDNRQQSENQSTQNQPGTSDRPPKTTGNYISVSVFGGSCAACFQIGQNGRVYLETAHIDASGAMRNGRPPVLWYDKHITSFDFDEAAMWVALLTGTIGNLIGPSKSNPNSLYHNPKEHNCETWISCDMTGTNLFLRVSGTHITQTRNGEPKETRTIFIKRERKQLEAVNGEQVKFCHALPIPITQQVSLASLFLHSMQNLSACTMSDMTALKLAQSVYRSQPN